MRGRNRRTVERAPGARREAILRVLRLSLPTVGALSAVALLGWGAWRVGVKGGLLRITELRISGTQRASAAELRDLSPIRPGDHLYLSDLDGLERALRRNPWVASVAIERRPPHLLEVQVTERRAAALVELGGLYLVDEGGRVFKRAAPGDGLDLPVVTGIPREDHVERRAEVEALLRGALALLDQWERAGLERRAPVSEVHLDRDRALTLFAGAEGMEIRLGQGELPQKLERLGRVLAQLEQDGRKAEVVHLDNRRRPDWVAVRLAGWRGEAGGRPVAAVEGRAPRGP